MNNLGIWEKVRQVPDSAKKTIGAGRLKGMTDINPVWRIKTLTELYGLCGIGWYSEITKQWLEQGSNGEITVFCNINLYIKDSETGWSKPIPGVGGSKLVTKETAGLYTSDECYKMAYTDAISVACKQLGIGADVYWEADKTKYSTQQQEDKPKPVQPQPQQKPPQQQAQQQTTNTITEAQAKRLFAGAKGNQELVREIMKNYDYTSTKDIKKADYDAIYSDIELAVKVGERE